MNYNAQQEPGNINSLNTALAYAMGYCFFIPIFPALFQSRFKNHKEISNPEPD